MTTQKEQIKQHWEDPQTVSLRDDNLRRLETEAVASHLGPEQMALDLGCGDGVNSLEYACKVRHLMGVDYSETMVARAQARQDQARLANLEFRHLGLEDTHLLDNQFDVVITQRCLINLTSLAEQEAALRLIHRLLRPGGVYLMLESVEEGRQRLNDLRGLVGLPPLAMPWHNRFLGEAELHQVAEPLFVAQERQDFSLYYLISRVLAPVMGLEYTDPVSKSMDQAARQMQQVLGLKELEGIGPQRLYIWRRPI